MPEIASATPARATGRARRLSPDLVARSAGLGALLALAVPGGVSVAQAQQDQAPTQASFPADFTGIVELMSPAVVGVTTRREVTRPEGRIPGLEQLPESFREFFGRGGPLGDPPGEPDVREARALGSGFLISDEGHVVTNNHVIAGAAEIEIVVMDAEEPIPAEVVGQDPATDLAVLKIEPQVGMRVAEWGDSDAMQPGAWTIAIGSPFGLGGTVTVGVLSARSRDIRVGPYDDFLQTDASINRGNSGGPLLNEAGRVIGVNTAIFSPTGANIGIGFAVPASVAQEVVSELIERGRVERGFLGVRLQALTPALSRALGLETDDGALVAGVEPDSPAAAAGIEEGDVVVGFAGEPVEDPRMLSRQVAEREPGAEVTLTIRSNGEEREATVVLGSREPAEPAGAEAAAPEEDMLGLSLSPIPEVMRRELGLPDEVGGALVQEVQPGAPGAEAGLVQGDVITRAGEEPVESPADVADAWRAAREAGEPLLLRVLRDGDPLFVAVEPEAG